MNLSLFTNVTNCCLFMTSFNQQLPMSLICTAYHAVFWIIMPLVGHVSFYFPIFCDQYSYNAHPIWFHNAVFGVDLVY